MSYADVIGQRSMAFDLTRNRAYAAAIERAVTPDSVVLDVGCGLGIHGLVAAKAGARKVYLVDTEAVVHCALEVAQRNGLGDRVQAFQGRIEDIELPEKVDVIISVFTGNLLFSENLLPALYAARDRWLKPGGVLIPDAAQLMLAPVSAPRAHEESIASWAEPHLGIDFSSLRRFAANTMQFRRQSDFHPQFIAAPEAVVDLDLMTTNAADCDVSVQVGAALDADCTGMLAWIRMRLGEQWLGTGPLDRELHWTPGFLPVDPPIPVRRGDALSLSVKFPAHGEYTWQIAAPAGRRRHSTFLGQIRSLADLRKLAETFVPTLNERGAAASDVFAAVAGGRNNGEIADALFQRYPRQFANRQAALEFVRGIVARYAD
ncbi:MAG: class I SAM-dependent methyltransferase [Burkholderiales bacterium]|nr:class I SAM-dependent methyltransferase [Pseudomonadota bacterium]MCC7067051.1 class I SAM-dependent methyltransferase [Burkholderiales bacterium]